MLPKTIQNLIRVFSVLIAVVLIIQPWFFTSECQDPFLISSWNILGASMVASCVLAVMAIFYKPKKGSVPFLYVLFGLFFIAAYSTRETRYLPTFRTTVFVVAGLVLLLFFRLMNYKKDFRAIASTIALSGSCMAVYCILQINGIDCLNWPYKHMALGTLANQNYCGIFLIVSAMITLGCACDIPLKDKRAKISFAVMFIVQTIGIWYCRKYGINRCFALALVAFVIICAKRKFPNGWLWRRAYVSGLIFALFITGFYWLSYKGISDYNWSNISFLPNGVSVPTRLVMWKMGFDVFLEKPWLGAGPGMLPFLLQQKRPFNGSLLGLNTFNQDPHSLYISLLAEYGFVGVWLVSSFLCMMVGVFVRKIRYEEIKYETTESESESSPESSSEDALFYADPECETKTYKEKAKKLVKTVITTLTGFFKELFFNTNVSQWQLPWLNTAVASLIVYLAYKNGFITIKPAFYSIPLIIAFAGVYCAFVKSEKTNCEEIEEPGKYLKRASFVSVIIYLVYSIFNNSSDMVPVSGLMLVAVSIVFSWNMPDVRWQRRRSIYALAYSALPFMFSFVAYTFQCAYQAENMAVYNGIRLYRAKQYQNSLEQFTFAIQNNPQSLRAFYGSACCYEALGNTDKALEMYRRLDSLVPNVYGANYFLARRLLENGKVLEAHRYALKNLERERFPTSFELLVQVLLQEGKLNEAEQAAREGLEFIPPGRRHESAAADRLRLTLAYIVSEKGDYNECKTLLESIKSELKNDSRVLYLRSMLLSKDNKEVEALAAFEALLVKEPNNVGLLNAVGYLLCKFGDDLERAQALLERAYREVRSHEPVLLSDLLMVSNSLGLLYWKQGKIEAASELLKISYEQCPDDWVNLKEERKRIWEDFKNSIKEDE